MGGILGPGASVRRHEREEARHLRRFGPRHCRRRASRLLARPRAPRLVGCGPAVHFSEINGSHRDYAEPRLGHPRGAGYRGSHTGFGYALIAGADRGRSIPIPDGESLFCIFALVSPGYLRRNQTAHRWAEHTTAPLPGPAGLQLSCESSALAVAGSPPSASPRRSRFRASISRWRWHPCRGCHVRNLRGLV